MFLTQVQVQVLVLVLELELELVLRPRPRPVLARVPVSVDGGATLVYTPTSPSWSPAIPMSMFKCTTLRSSTKAISMSRSMSMPMSMSIQLPLGSGPTVS